MFVSIIASVCKKKPVPYCITENGKPIFDSTSCRYIAFRHWFSLYAHSIAATSCPMVCYPLDFCIFWQLTNISSTNSTCLPILLTIAFQKGGRDRPFHTSPPQNARRSAKWNPAKCLFKKSWAVAHTLKNVFAKYNPVRYFFKFCKHICLQYSVMIWREGLINLLAKSYVACENICSSPIACNCKPMKILKTHPCLNILKGISAQEPLPKRQIQYKFYSCKTQPWKIIHFSTFQQQVLNSRSGRNTMSRRQWITHLRYWQMWNATKMNNYIGSAMRHCYHHPTTNTTQNFPS